MYLTMLLVWALILTSSSIFICSNKIPSKYLFSMIFMLLELRGNFIDAISAHLLVLGKQKTPIIIVFHVNRRSLLIGPFAIVCWSSYRNWFSFVTIILIRLHFVVSFDFSKLLLMVLWADTASIFLFLITAKCCRQLNIQNKEIFMKLSYSLKLNWHRTWNLFSKYSLQISA